MNELVSVGIPIYNVEPYLGKCLDSLQNQTYRNIEIIMVDNGSTDNSCAIARKYVADDKRFVLYQTKKRGASSARNICLNKARGQYIAFVDSDDWVELDYLETMVRAIETSSADMVVSDFFSGDELTGKWTDKIIVGKDILREYLNNGVFNRVYNKLFKRELLEGIRFPEGRDVMEDGVFTPKVLAKAKRISRLSKPLYHYRIRQGSLIHKKQSSEEQCGYFTNTFERIEILANVADDSAIINNLKSQFKNALYAAIVANIDLDVKNTLFYIKQSAKALLKVSYEFATMQNLLILCSESMNAKDLNHKICIYSLKHAEIKLLLKKFKHLLKVAYNKLYK